MGVYAIGERDRVEPKKECEEPITLLKVDDPVYIITDEPIVTLLEVVMVGPQGPQGPRGFMAATYIHYQGRPSAEWLIKHDMGKYPSVSVVDSTGRLVIGDVRYQDDSTLRVGFIGAFAGRAYLN